MQKTCALGKYPLIIVLLLLMIGANRGYSQTFNGSLSATPVNLSCYSGSMSVNYTASISPPIGYVYGVDYTFNLSLTTFTLKYTSLGPGGPTLMSNTGGTTGSSLIYGSFNLSSLTPEVYTIYASVNINNIRDGRTSVVNTTVSFTVGYQVTWLDMLDMQALPNTYSCKRAITTSGVTYGRSISANILAASANGWFDIGAQFGGLTGSVFVPIGKTTTSVTDPTTQTNYIEFRRTGASTGAIYVKAGGTTYTLSGVNFTDRIFVRRTSGNSIKFYKGNSVATLISGSPTITYSGELNVAVFAANLNDGATDILTGGALAGGFSCVFDNQYFNLKDDVEQSVAYVGGSVLKFKYNEEYFDVNGTLNYTIKCLNDDAAPTPVTVNKPKHTNWLEITLGAGGIPVTSGNIYLLEVSDAKGHKQYLKFKKQ